MSTKQKAPRKRIFIVRTHDRMAFRNCRRAWGWGSINKGNRGPLEPVNYFWTGSGIHFALEDFHGYNVYGKPSEAFKAYVEACRKTSRLKLPADYKEETTLATQMLDYYSDEWLPQRPNYETVWVDGVPQVEVEFEIELPIPEQWADFWEKVVYQGTIDRVAKDEYGRLWIVDYKSAIRLEQSHLETDSQINAYCWAGAHLYGRNVEGFVYQQHRKAVPDDPRYLASGKLSQNKSQLTTRRRYKDALLNIYGEMNKVPQEYLDTLNYFTQQEDDKGDKFIRRTLVRRNAHQIEAEGTKILLELEDMLNPDLPLYPNPRFDCGRCFFNQPCISLDDGSDWVQILDENTEYRVKEDKRWREHLPKAA